MQQETIQVIDPIYAVKELLSELKRLKAKKDAECSELMIKYIDAQEALEAKQAPYTEQAQKIEQEIKTIMLDVQRPIKTESGMVTYRNGYVRASYNREALDNITDPVISQLIRTYRKETITEPIIKVEVY